MVDEKNKSEEFWDKRWNELNKFKDADRHTQAAHNTSKEVTEEDIANAKEKYEGLEKFIHKTINALKISPKSFVEMGCGTGYWIDFFIKNYGLSPVNILATDISSAPLEFVKAKYSDINILKYDISRDSLGRRYLPRKNAFWRKRFNICTAMEMFQHVVTEDGLTHAIKQIESCSDLCIICPIYNDQDHEELGKLVDENKHYKKYWRFDDYATRLNKMQVVNLNPSKPNLKLRRCLVLIRK